MRNLNEINRKLVLPVRYALAVAIFAVAFALRFVLVPIQSGLLFMTFYPAMIISFYLCGIGPGILVSVLSAIAADYVFAAPHWQIKFTSTTINPSITFVVSAVLVGVAVRQLRSESNKNLALLRNASDGIHILNAEGNLIEASDSFCAMLGYRLDEMIGMHVSRWDAQFSDVEIAQLIRQQIARGGRSQFETRHRRKDGTIFDVEISGSPLLLNGRQVLFNSSRDITARKQAEEQLMASLESSIAAISATVEMRDPYTAGHQRRMADLAAAIGRELGLPEDQVHGIHLAGTVHDLGKIRIPAEILCNPGQLNDTEYQLIMLHPQAGYDILKKISFPWPIAQMVLQHHERLDGTGYPFGLKGESILLEARILAVADAVEAIASHRPYRAGHGIEVALSEIAGKRGTLYDQTVVDACVRLFRERGYTLS